MAQFDMLTVDEARGRLTSSKQSKIRAQYLAYVAALVPGQVGRLVPEEGEPVGLVRTRLSTAVRTSGRKVIIRRAGNELLFWLNGEDDAATGVEMRAAAAS